jgi:hypothetical protein
MNQCENETHSFIIKLWCEEPATEAGPAFWRGHITHVPSGQRRYFQELAAIAAFIAPWLHGTPPDPDAPTPGDVGSVERDA